MNAALRKGGFVVLRGQSISQDIIVTLHLYASEDVRIIKYMN